MRSTKGSVRSPRQRTPIRTATQRRPRTDRSRGRKGRQHSTTPRRDRRSGARQRRHRKERQTQRQAQTQQTPNPREAPRSRHEHEGAQGRAARDPTQRTRRSDREATTEPTVGRVAERSHKPHALTSCHPSRDSGEHSLDRQRRETGTRQVGDAALANHTVSGANEHGVAASRNRRRHNPTIGNVSRRRRRSAATHEHDSSGQRDRRRQRGARNTGQPRGTRDGETGGTGHGSSAEGGDNRTKGRGRESTSNHSRLQTPEERPRSGEGATAPREKKGGQRKKQAQTPKQTSFFSQTETDP